MRKWYKSLSLFLAAVMVFAMLPGMALAAEPIAITNGDFEDGTNGWVLTGYSSVAADEWAKNNTTNSLSLWLSDSEAVDGSAAYTVSLNPGTYYFTFDISGAEMDSGLAYSITSGGETLASGSSITTGGWDVWQTVTTSEFTLTSAASVTFALSGNQTAGYWGNLDNLTLYGSGTVAVPQIAISNGDFESGTTGWVLSGYTTVEANEWAANNTTNTLSLWLSDDAEAAGAASYTAELSKGTYYFTFDLSGAEMDSGLAYSITSGGDTLVSGSSITTTGWDVWQTVTTAEFTLISAASVTFTLSGTQPAAYWGNLDNLCLYGTGSVESAGPGPVDSDLYVPYIAGTDGDFMRGMDVSSVLSILNSGATFKDFEDNTLDGQGFFNLLAQTGTNWVRIRVWNDPFDASGKGYGGGNCDVEAAKIMGQWATNAGLRVLIDFHYSDFWADPGKQQAPKAWANYSVSQKADAVYEYTKSSVQYLVNNGVDVGMVQVGNETTNSICGVSGWSNMCSLFSAGARAVREVDKDILVAVHFTNPERSGNYANFAKQLNTYGVDYDVFASSYYPYWHGTLSNLTSVLKNVADTYGKQVIVAETSWGFTLEDGDGHSNTVRQGSNDSGEYDFCVQGQADEIAAVTQAVRNVGDAGIGVFYWEPAWIPVQVYDGNQQTLNQNKVLWEEYGSGWASSYAGEYDPDDAGIWYGGSSWDNQALFNFEGMPLESLRTYLYMQTGTTGPDMEMTGVESPKLTYTVGATLSLPQTLTVSYNVGADQQLPVSWNQADVDAVDMNTPGIYTVKGTVEGGMEATCTVEVKAENLLLNPGFESSDLSMYTISQAYAKRTTDDPYAGSYSLHFYNSGNVNFTAQQSITLQPGEYSFSLYGQGGDMGDGQVCYAYVDNGSETLTQSFTLTGWAIWKEPSISFTVKEETTVTVGISVTASQGGAWGTFDEWYLCKTGDVEAEPISDGLHKGAESNYFYYLGGKVATDFTGFVDNSAGSWYVLNGQVQLSYTGLVTVDGERYYVKGGCINDFTGLKKLEDTWLYFDGGKVDTAYAGLIGHNGQLAYVENGEVDFNKKDLVEYNGELYYVKYGLWSPGFTGMMKASDEVWRYVKDGIFDDTYTGLAKNAVGWWYVENGLIDTTYTGFITFGAEQYYVKYGQVMLTTTGIVEVDGESCYVKGGMFQSSYKGLITVDAGTWYLADGKVDFTYNGEVTAKGVTYTVVNGFATAN